MNPLPPLRTARPAAVPPAPGVADTPPPAPVALPPEVAGLAPGGRSFVAEVVAAGLLTAAEAGDAVRRLSARASRLGSTQELADALVALKVLTRFQVTRVMSGQGRGLAFGPYRVRDRANSGTVGVVFLAEHPVLGRTVALKVLAEDEGTHPDVVRRFRTEVRVLAKLSHPHVVTLYDGGIVPGRADEPTMHYLALEYLPGGDVENFVYEHGTQPVGVACEWGRQAAAGLWAAHAAGLTHRDVKPSNLLLTDARAVKLCDFGLVREFGSVDTRPRATLGSIEFMAPELWADATTAGPPADVYGLGVTLFWVLTGKLPFGELRTQAERVEAVRTGTPRRLRELTTVAPELDALVARMLDRNPANRPTAGEAAAALAKFATPTAHPAAQEEPIIVDEDTEVEHLRATVRQLEDVLVRGTRAGDDARAAVVTALAAAAVGPHETAEHQARVAGYCRVLATKLAAKPEWATFADPRAVDELVRVAAAHDLGRNVSDDDTHPATGDAVLETLSRAHGDALPFLRTLRAVVRHHHERWDGTGFPDKLAANAIPPAARVVAVADAYDTLRKADGGRSHEDAVRAIGEGSGLVFDPAVVAALRACAEEIVQVHFNNPDPDEVAELVVDAAADEMPPAPPPPKPGTKSSRSLSDILDGGGRR